MKPIRLATILLLCLLGAWASGQALAQASFSLQNHSYLDGIDAPVFDWTGGLLSGPEWRVELYGGAAADSLSPAIERGSRLIIGFFRPGYFYSTSGFLSIRDVPPEWWAWLQVRVWDVGLGTTYEEAVARGLGGYGESPLFYARGGNPIPPGVSSPSPLIGLQSFSVLPVVPEPSTWVLVLLGGGIVWACRRRPPNQLSALTPGCRASERARLPHGAGASRSV